MHLERTPRVAVALLEVITHRFRGTTVKREQFATSDTVGRLAARIVERYGKLQTAQSETGRSGSQMLAPAQMQDWSVKRPSSRHAISAGSPGGHVVFTSGRRTGSLGATSLVMVREISTSE